MGGKTVGPPGERLAFVTEDKKAGWITTRQKPETVKHAWPGALVNSFFRNEGPTLSSELVRAAVALTVDIWGPLPARGIITFIDAEKTKRRRSKRARPGACYHHAGWREIGVTGGGARSFRARRSRMGSGERVIMDSKARSGLAAALLRRPDLHDLDDLGYVAEDRRDVHDDREAVHLAHVASPLGGAANATLTGVAPDAQAADFGSKKIRGGRS
jgi:hypothetical protein